MTTNGDPGGLFDAVRAALRSEARIGLHGGQIELEMAGDALVMAGEVETVAAKKLALRRAAAVAGVSGIIDRLRVKPAQRMGDDEIRVLVRDALVQEPAFADYRIREVDKGRVETVQQPAGAAAGEITVSVEDGVVTLDGEVPGRAQQRLAGVLAWWVPGSRDVIDGLGIEPGEPDSDEELVDAVRLALEKDVFVNASQIRVGARDFVVTLFGSVPTESEREMAEFDAWYVAGVDDVINNIEVRA